MVDRSIAKQVYGFFCGGDPRDFDPDEEMCSPEEIANHKRACKFFDDCEAAGLEPLPEKCPSGWLEVNGYNVHVLRAPYGIGVNFFDPKEFDDAAERGERRDG